MSDDTPIDRIVYSHPLDLTALRAGSMSFSEPGELPPIEGERWEIVGSNGRRVLARCAGVELLTAGFPSVAVRRVRWDHITEIDSISPEDLP